MKRSTDRILTTHVGSLARPDALVPLLKAQDLARPYDQALFEKLVREAVDAGGIVTAESGRLRIRPADSATS